jgi:tetratricopeptide (TPR) repeat protein
MKPIHSLCRSSTRWAFVRLLSCLLCIQVSLASDATTQSPKNGATLAQAGWSEYETGRFEAAKSLMEQAIKLSPTTADYHAALAQIDEKLGDENAAIKHLKQAILLKPSDAEFRLNLAEQLQTQNKDQEALHTLQAAHLPVEISAAWHFSRGFSLFRIGRFTEAATEFKTIVDDPRFKPSASFFLGNIAYSQERFDESEPYLATAVRMGNTATNKAYNAYTYDYGLLLFKQGKFAEAEQQFLASIERYSSDPLPWMFAGKCEAELGNYSRAIQMLETSIKTDPTLQLGYYELARLQQRHGDPKRAAELFDKIGQMKKAEIDVEEARAMKLKTGIAR